MNKGVSNCLRPPKGIYGGSVAAPVAKKVLERYFAKKNDPETEKEINSQASLIEKRETLKVFN